MGVFGSGIIKTQNSVMEITVYMFFCYGKTQFMTISVGGNMTENTENDENDDTDKCRVVTSVTEKERLQLKILAKHDGRSMSSYLRYILRKEIEANWD